MSLLVGHSKVKNTLVETSPRSNKSNHSDTEKTLPDDIPFFQAIKLSVYNAFPIFVTMLIAKIATISSFNFLKDYPDENVLAAYGIGNGFLNVICYAIIYSLCMGMLTRLAQAYGDEAYKLLGYYLHRGFIINVIAFLSMSVLIFYSDKGFALFDYSDELSSYTKTYLIWSIPGIFLYLIFTTLQYYLLAINIVVPTAIMQIISAPIYIGSAYYLTSVHNHGLVGSAIALLIQNGATVVMIIGYIWIKNPLPQSIFCIDSHSFQKLWDLFKHEFMIGSVVFIQWIGVEIIGLAAGSLSVSQTAGYTATYMMNQAYYMIPCALDNAVVSYVSSSMGARQPKSAKKFILACALLSGIFAVILGFVSYFYWNYIIDLLVETEEAIHYATVMIRIYILAIVPDFLQIVLSGSLRAVDRKVAGFFVTCISMYAVAIPIAFVLCFKYGWEIEGLNWGMNVGFYCCFILDIIFFISVNLEHQSKKIYQKISEDKEHANKHTKEVFDQKGDYNKLLEDSRTSYTNV